MSQEPSRRRFDSYNEALAWLDRENFQPIERPEGLGEIFEETLTGAEACVIRLPSGATHVKLIGWL